MREEPKANYIPLKEVLKEAKRSDLEGIPILCDKDGTTYRLNYGEFENGKHIILELEELKPALNGGQNHGFIKY